MLRSDVVARVEVLSEQYPHVADMLADAVAEMDVLLDLYPEAKGRIVAQANAYITDILCYAIIHDGEPAEVT